MRGSLTEVVTQLEICADRKYISAHELKAAETKAFNVLRLLNALMESLREKRSEKLDQQVGKVRQDGKID